jgi:hypothetical protein
LATLSGEGGFSSLVFLDLLLLSLHGGYQHHSGPKRETHEGCRHTMKPHPFRYVLGGEALSQGLCVGIVTPPPFGSPATPLSRRRGALRLCAPALQRVCLSRGAEAPDAASAPYSCEREGYVRQSTKEAPNFSELRSLLKNPFASCSAPGSGAEYAVSVAFSPCFRALLDRRPGSRLLFQPRL